MDSEEKTVPSKETRAAEATEAEVAHSAPDDHPEASSDAPDGSEASAEVAGHYREMTDKGARVQGEGQLP